MNLCSILKNFKEEIMPLTDVLISKLLVHKLTCTGGFPLQLPSFQLPPAHIKNRIVKQCRKEPCKDYKITNDSSNSTILNMLYLAIVGVS